MRLVAYAELRQRWRALVVLGLLATTWLAATMTAAAGARRTDDAADWFLRATRASDAQFDTSPGMLDDADADLRAAVESHPAVTAVDSIWYASSGIAYDRGAFVVVAAPETGAWSSAFDRPLLLDGRRADPEAAEEVVVTRQTADLLDVGVGDELVLPTWDREVWETWQDERGGGFPPFSGPEIRVEVVGVVRLDADVLDDQAGGLLAVATPAFRRRWEGDVGSNGTAVVARLDPTVRADDVADDVSTAIGEPVNATTRDEIYVTALRGAGSTASIGLWMFAVVAGLSGFVLLLLASVHELQLANERNAALPALGVSRKQRAAALGAPLLTTLGLAVVVGAAASIAASGRFPVGPTRRAEPLGTAKVDPLVLLAGAVAAVLLAIAALVFGTRRGAAAKAPRPSRLHRSPIFGRNAAIRSGAGLAVTSTDRRTVFGTVAIAVGGIVAAAWFSASAHALGADPARWGYTWSSSPEVAFEYADYAAYQDALEETSRTPGVRSVADIDHRLGTIDGRLTTITAIFAHTAEPPVSPLLDGRLPGLGREIALGARVAHDLGVAIGDHVIVGSMDHAATLEVVGLVVPPPLVEPQRSGDGAVVSMSTMEQLDLEPQQLLLAIAYEDGAERSEVEAALSEHPGWSFVERSHPYRPTDLDSRVAAQAVVGWLGAFLVVFGVGAAASAAMRQARRHTPDVKVLRAIGFTRHDIRVVGLTMGTIAVVVGGTVGVLLGLAIGRRAWVEATGDLGVVDHLVDAPAVVALALVTVAVPLLLAGVVSTTRAARPQHHRVERTSD